MAMSAMARAGVGGGRSVPFLATGRGAESYNVVSAVSKAVRKARKGRPREVRRPFIVVAVGVVLWVLVV